MTSTRSWRGLTFGGDSPFQITQEDGLEGSEVRSGVRNLPRLHGATPGSHFAEPRIIVLELNWAADTPAAAQTLTDQLLAVTGPSETSLYEYGIVGSDLTERMVRGRVSRRVLPRDQASEAVGSLKGRLVFECPDPRIYSPEPTGIVVPEFDIGGEGFDWVVDWPVDAAEPTVSYGTAVNTGNSDAYPLIRFAAAVEVGQVTLTNLTNGAVLDIQTTIAIGQTLTCDMDALIRVTGDPIIHISGASRFADWQTPRIPFALAPGTNTLTFTHDGTAGDVTCRVDWRHTSL